MVHLVSKTAARLFFARVFEIKPDLQPLYQEGLSIHQIKLMATLKLLVDTADQPNIFAQATEQLSIQQHLSKSEFSDCLCWMLKSSLGRSYTPDAIAAWEHFCTEVNEVVTPIAAVLFDTIIGDAG